MEYNFNEIEKKWQKFWSENKTFKTDINLSKPKFYVLDMFPYPSGAGLHVGHPLGYIASDIYTRYMRLCGYNVLHPMGYDAFGLPAEQYAIQTGQHPAITTDKNIKRYREQLDKIGFSYDWERQVKTCDPEYYKWTQWAFIQMFKHWYNNKTNKADSIENLIKEFEINGNKNINATCSETPLFSANEWKNKTEKEQQEILLNYRLAYLADTMVNWCPALGTVLANDEVKEGLSVRGGHPVEQKKMRQWLLRISAYAERLLNGLDSLSWSDSLKEMQRNWIGKSEGAEVQFHLSPALSKGKGERPPLGNGERLPFGKGEISPIEKGERPPYYTTDSYGWASLKDNIIENRKNPTEAEAILWKELKGKKIDYKIRRQHAIGRFIVDFACLSNQTVIEVDGKYHIEQKEKDEERTKILNDLGFTVIRFTNEEVISNVADVISKIKISLDDKTTKLADSKVLPRGEDLGENLVSKTTTLADSKVLPRGEDLGVVFTIFTPRPDTIFGCTFMVLAPESELVEQVTTPEYKSAIENYINETKKRTERERMAEVKKVTGQFTGAYAINPFTNQEIPIYISDYVLAGYGTGAIMAVPGHDSRDFKFAKHFNLPIIQVVTKEGEQPSDPETWEDSYDSKDGIMINSGILNGMTVKNAISHIISEIEYNEIGKLKVNYRLRDAIFSRQRYWGEPFPVYYKNEMPYVFDEKDLPLELPEVDKFLPTEDGQPPLGRAKNWNTKDGFPIELSTMPGFAGSSAYYLRYMDNKNPNELVSKEANNYWQDVDLYIGGTEHATGHLIYSRFWNKFLFDLGFVCKEEPFKKLINQGMIQGLSMIATIVNISNRSISEAASDYAKRWNTRDLTNEPIEIDENSQIDNVVVKTFIFPEYFGTRIPFALHENIPIEFVNFTEGKYILTKENLSNLKKAYPQFKNYEIGTFEDLKGIENNVHETYSKLFNGDFVTLRPQVEKMSKSKFNVVNPDEIVEKYGADTLRLYEMFLGPLEMSKPWDTKGIDGVHRFLRKLWRLFFDKENNFVVSDEEPTNAEYKILHKTIKKIKEDIENFSFNTSVSAFMICVNELG
ncbi:MAG: leucine--tRNA ligase, partial [Bacteroidetes bacterium GWA2_31_9]